MKTLLLAALLLAQGVTVPPGAIYSSDPAVVCQPGFAASRPRPSTYTKLIVRRRDHMPSAIVDHRIPVSLGGSNRPTNLMAQERAESLAKDRVEARLLKAVCVTHTMALDSAQRGIYADWRSYR